MRRQHISTYLKIPRWCVCGLGILCVSVPLIGRADPLKGGITCPGLAEEIGEKTERDPISDLIEGISKSGRFRRPEVRRVSQGIGISSGRKATDYLTRLEENRQKSEPRCWRLRLEISLEILRCFPDKNSLGVLEELLNSADGFAEAEILTTMSLQEGGAERVERFLQSSDDIIRGAAISALSRVWPLENVRVMIETIKKQGVDLAGTSTGRALSKAQQMLDYAEWLSRIDDFGERLCLLLDMGPYAPLPIPVGPRLGTDPARAFVWEELQLLWQENQPLAREIINEYRRSHPERKGFVELVINDLVDGTCPVPRKSPGAGNPEPNIGGE